MFRLRTLLEALHGEAVAFVVVGGVAAGAHGSAHLTSDLDVCYRRDAGNLERIVRALDPLRPRLRARGEPEGVSILWEPATLRAGLHFTLVTDVGDIDLLGEIPGLGDYEAVREAAEPVVLYGRETWILSLEGLIAAREAAGRPKDQLLLPELRALLALRDSHGG